MDKNDFEFNYSAPTSEEKREIESIRRNYMTPDKKVSKLEELRKLDRKAKNIPLISSISLGIISLLIFGLGLALILEWNLLAFGIVISIVGAIPMPFAYPLYKYLDKKMKELYGEEILKLSDELLNEERK